MAAIIIPVALGVFVVLQREEAQHNSGQQNGQQLSYIGPTAGAITSDSAELWMRTNRKAKIEFRYGTTPDLSASTITSFAVTLAFNDFTTKIPIHELLPDTTYYYTPRINNVDIFKEDYPQFQTAPVEGREHEFTFTVLTDFGYAKIQDSPKAFLSASLENPSFTIIGGDFDHRDPGRKQLDLNKIRQNTRIMYRENLSHNVIRRKDLANFVLRKTGIVHLWDDHDFAKNNSDGNYVGKKVGLEVYDEYFTSYPRPSPDSGIFQSWTWGHVQFFLLDGRYNRNPSRDPDTAEKTMLGDIQKSWLKEGLQASTATWKIVISGSVFNPTTKCGADNWCAYKTEGKELTDFIREQNIKNIFIVSGDVHAGAITDGTNSTYDTFWEMMVPGADVVHSGCDTTTWVGPNKFGEWTHGTWGEGFRTQKPPKDCWGYGQVDVRTNPHRLELYVKDEDGNVKIHATVPTE